MHTTPTKPSTHTHDQIETNPVSDSNPQTIFPIRTKIVATLGPANDTPEALERLIEAGVNVFRFNFSHGTLDGQAARLLMVRKVIDRLGASVAILGDLQGPKIRISNVADEGIELTAGQDVIFRKGVEKAFVESDGTVIFGTTYEDIINEVQTGQRVLINDGAIRMLALDCEHAAANGDLRLRVMVGGLVTSHKGINLPESEVNAPAITERDRACVEFAVANQMDFLALSFVRKPEDIIELRNLLASMCPVSSKPGCEEDKGATIPIIAKIEKPQAVENIEAIVDVSDAIMVARGDLGVEMDIAKTPIVQKKIIKVCATYGKPCIVATQMLETMITASSPTRAEASDVANAILDGADAVMLSGETAVGKHPPLVVETMRRILDEAEQHDIKDIHDASPPEVLLSQHNIEAAIAHGAWYVANDTAAKLVVCWSEMGRMARYLSQNRLKIPILAYSSSPMWTRRMALLNNVTAIRSDPPTTGRLADWTDTVENELLTRGWVTNGDIVVLAAGKPLGNAAAVNTIAILKIGDQGTGFRVHDR